MPDDLKNNSENEDDVEIDVEDLDDSVVAEEAQGETIKKLRGKLRGAEAKAKEYLDNWQRAQADFVNLRKRDEEAKQQFMKFANAALLEELIPVLDSLTLAIVHGNPEGKPAASNGAGKDVEVIYKQLMQVLKRNGFEEIDPVGESFDPRLHEAIGSIPTDKDSEDQKILEVVQKGYILGDKIIRPAKVRIGEFTS